MSVFFSVVVFVVFILSRDIGNHTRAVLGGFISISK